MAEGLIRPDWPAPSNVIACSTTREGGVSEASYAALNLGAHVGDLPSAVMANRKTLTAALPADIGVQWLDQIHGTAVFPVSAALVKAPPADASYTREPAVACAILTADCLPVLFCSRSGDVVAAAHAGWRGLVGGVLEATIDAMQCDPQSLLAWLGPAIGPRCFEVGAEVRTQFLAAALPRSSTAIAACFLPIKSRQGFYYADLYALAKLRLQAAGVSAIYGGGLCTYSDEQRFYSYRRDGQTGRMASIIAILPG